MLRQSLPQPPSPHQLFHIWFGLQFGRHLRIAVALALVLAIGCNGNSGQNQHVKQTPSAGEDRLLLTLIIQTSGMLEVDLFPVSNI